MRHTRIVVDRYGGPEELHVVAEEAPEPRAGEARVRVEAAGVALPDVLARQGIHPETPLPPFTPGWDLVGTVERLGKGAEEIEIGARVAALPIHGAYAELVCLSARELVPVPPELDAAEAVSLILNYVTAYQMLHRSAKAQPGERALIHGAAGGVGTALLQLGRLVELEMIGTCSPRSAPTVSALGAVPIDYRHPDLVRAVSEVAAGGVDVVFDPIGGAHLWQSRRMLRRGGRVIGYGLRTSLRGEDLAAESPGRRRRFGGVARFTLYVVGGILLPGRRRVIPYSIQTLKRLDPRAFRDDLAALLELLRQRRIEPLVARRFPLTAAREAHELLEKGGVTGKIVLVADAPAR